MNSFGALSQEADSEFYFAVSIREVSRFLLQAGVRTPTTGTPCRSLADVSRDEADLAASERVRADEAARVADAAQDKARRAAQLDVIGERENGMALAGVALLLALTSATACVMLIQKARSREAIAAGAIGILLLAGGVAAWVMRPALSEIDSRAETIASRGGGKAAPKAAAPLAGDLLCILDVKRSRITVSSTADLQLNWRGDGCADQRSQFAQGPDGWFRIFVPGDVETVTVSSFDPASGEYRAERYLLDYDTMARLRTEREKAAPPQCGGGIDAARRMAAGQLSLKTLLPPAPNERLLYHCAKAGT